jgi:hypothetical protein
MPRYACRVISVGFVLCMFTGCAPAPITSADSQRPIPAAHPNELIPSKGSDLSSESWRYAQWGMTPSQVVAASAGRATLLKGKSERGSAEDTKRFDEMQRISRENNISLSLLDQFKGATSSINVGGLQLYISFMLIRLTPKSTRFSDGFVGTLAHWMLAGLSPLHFGCCHEPAYSPSYVGATACPLIPSNDRNALNG